MQDFQGYISPGILTAFVFGMIVKRTPPAAGVAALLLNVPIYGMLHLIYFDHIAFLDKMAITCGCLVLAMATITVFKPLKEPKTMPVTEDMDLKPSGSVVWLGALVIFITVSLYIIFW